MNTGSVTVEGVRAVTDTESLSLSDVPDPAADPGQVVIDVAAAGVNRADLLQRRGAYPPPKGASEILGLEVSGRISAVGADSGGWRVGDEVCALLAGGGYAEKVAVPAAQVLPVPAGVDLVSAAALPEVACTVVSNLILTANLRAGELLLIHGGASRPGTPPLHLAAAPRAPTAVTPPNRGKLDRCAELGADILIDYTVDDFAQVMKDNGGADVILDIMGAKYLPGNIAALRTGGRLVTIGLQGGVKGELNMGVLLAKRLSVFGTTLRSRPVDGPGGKGEVVARTREVTWPLIEAGRVVPIIDSVFGVDDAAAAHARLDSGEAIGKVLLCA